jgi:cell division protein FtsZ
MAEVLPEIQTFARIKVCGIGGGGGQAVDRMIREKVQGIEFVAINTDAQALHHSKANTKVHIGKTLTKGLGAGADPNVGRKAAEESEKEIREMLKGADMVFITLGAGGGTGTGAAPMIARMARETGALVVAIATKPFAFEGERRQANADTGISELRDNVDTLITIPNDRLLDMIDRKTSLLDAFKVVDDVLQQGVQGISDLITVHGLINLDFADVKAIIQDAGSALMGIGRAKGDNRAVRAAQMAIDSPLLEVSIDGARGVLFNITGGRNMTMHEIDEAAKTITEAVDPSANIIFGAVLDTEMDDDIKITVVATGFDGAPGPTHQRPVTSASGAISSMNSVASPYVPLASEPETEEIAEPTPKRSFFSRERKPFIDEKPQTVAEVEEEPESIFDEPANPVVSSIEPETTTLEELTIREEEPEPLKPHRSGREIIERASRTVSTAADASPDSEDDLDIPAFIRRKVDKN